MTIFIIFIWFVIEQSTDAPQELYRRRLYSNSRAFILRFFALVWAPRRFAPLVGDFCLLLQSTWSGKQSGPDLVYPMLSIGIQQSGRLAKLILEHCKAVPQYELRAATPFPRGIDPPCVAVVDLDEVPQEVIAKGYSTQLDVHGLICMLMLLETMIILIIQVFFLDDWGPDAVICWVFYVFSILASCLTAALSGDGTLTLARRSDMSTPGYAILLDQDFTVVLSGNQNVVEAIGKGSFNLSHSNSVWNLTSTRWYRLRDYPLETLCEVTYVTILTLFLLLFRPPSTLEWYLLSTAIILTVTWLLRMFSANQVSLPRRAWFAATKLHHIALPPTLLFSIYSKTTTPASLFPFSPALFVFFFSSFGPTNWDGNYPIRSARFLDALGHPPVMKWEFDSHAASVTFQCLVLCRGIPRPIRSIDVLVLLDLLIPDQRDLWKAWKERVADRIVHEKDILFAPTIPTFADERQQQLKDHLDQAQFGYDTYMDSYRRRVPLYPVT